MLKHSFSLRHTNLLTNGTTAFCFVVAMPWSMKNHPLDIRMMFHTFNGGTLRRDALKFAAIDGATAL